MTINRSRHKLPSTWDTLPGPDDKGCLQISGLKVKYIGPGDEDKDAASVRADRPIPSDVSLYYYEVLVVNKGRDGFVGVGFSAGGVALNRLPGWEPHSYGYHGDDGMAFQSCGTGKPYGPVYATGDVVGALLNRTTKTISFIKNGIDLGIAFRNVQEDRLFPSVGMRTPDEEVVANLGGSGFKADVQSLEADAVQCMQEQVAETPLEFLRQEPDVDPQGMLLFNYLVHEGCWDTASRVAQDILLGRVQVSDQDRQNIVLQHKVRELIAAGQMLDAITAVNEAAPGTLESHPRVKFQLQCQHFVEMVRRKDDKGAVEFGRSTLSTASKTAADQQLLQDVLTLMAYNEPESSPEGYLMTHSHMANLATTVNAAILTHKGQWPESKLERLLKQLRAVSQELQSQGDPSAGLLDLPKLVASQGLQM